MQALQSGPAMSSAGCANDNISPLFQATVEATEEAIVNAMIAARTMTGNRGNTAHAIDHDALKRVLREHNRLENGTAQ
ncbi:MAG: P1 family peptidase [Woeseiaceae bacterium]|nr:P1 family peptidase [Woeseiaceae bacterium]